ncbi:MAG: PKD domain-containing protein [Poseidonia sp.]
MRAGDAKVATMLVMLLSASLAGCLGGDASGEDDGPISMNVYYDATSGTITERIQNGAVLSTTGVELSFDFARVTSKAGTIKTFSFDPGDDEDGSNTITVNANEQAEITYTFQTHGLFTAVLSATDESGNEASMELQLRIEKEIDWTQTNTDDPDAMVLATSPDCQCPTPAYLAVQSTITNRNDLLPGTQITVTWHLNDPDGEEQAFHTEQIGDGQEAAWTHDQYGVEGGDWNLNVSIDTGNDSIDINHVVLISYEANESVPNPLSAETTEREDESLSV